MISLSICIKYPTNNNNYVSYIYNIIIILMQKDYIKFQPMTDDDYQKHFPKSNNTKGHLSRGKKAKVHAIHFTKKLRDLIGKSEYLHFKDNKEHPIYRVLRGASDRWMYSPPQRHRMDKPGGFLIKKDRRITTSSNREYEKMKPPTPRCVANREALDAMNALQETQWEINLHLLQALFDVKLEGAENVGGGLLSNHPVCDWANKKEQLIDNISPKPIFRNVFSGADDAEEKREKEEMLGWVKRIIDHNANVFWHAWEIDFRGRLFAKCARLSPQGDDFNKAMIRFKHWKPLGKEKQDHTGIDWIHIHVHAFMEGIEIDADESDLPWFRGEKAEKKQTFTTRKKWVQDNLGRLREMAKYPNKFRNTLGLKEKSPEGDDVYQRLAALLELDRAHTEYEGNGQDWSKVYSGHPIYLDATCNGYQHASTLLGNRNLAELVNVVCKPGEEPRDLYAEVAKAAKEMSAVAPKQLTVAELKKLAKKHGLSGYSNLKKAQLVDALYGVIPDPEPRRKIVEILEIADPQKKDNNAEEIRIILRFPNISRYTFHKDEWQRIDYHKGRVARVKGKLTKAKKLKKLKNTKPTDDELRDIITNNHKLASSLLPNFIHSFDAYHMRKTVNECNSTIDDLSFWAVHDAFGTHACDVETMVGIVKHTFHDIHKGLDFNGWIGARSKDLKLKDILVSEYIIN